MNKILILEPLLEEVIKDFQNRYAFRNCVIDYKPYINADQIYDLISLNQYDVLIVRNMLVDKVLIESWRKSNDAPLAIIRAGSNISTIDVDAARDNNVKVMNTPGANSWAVAQHIILQLFILTKNFEPTLNANADTKLNINKDKSIYYSDTLVGQNIAVIGTGAIGSKVAMISSSLGLNVKAYSPNLTKSKAESFNAIYCSSIYEALLNANYITIQIPYNIKDTKDHPKTYHLINQKELSQVADGCHLISVSRANVINMDALQDAIRTGKISSVSLDLLSREIETLKQSHPNIIYNSNNIITPLIACESYNADYQITYQALNKAMKFIEGATEDNNCD